jgi:protein-tyrosine-phosphatase
VNVLFVCSDNTVLGPMAESILRGIAPGPFGVFSAGCVPRTALGADVLELLQAHRLPVAGLHPKGLQEVRFPAAPRMDFVITLSELAAAELWAEWPGEPLVAHWQVWDRDAAALATSEAMVRDAFWTLRRRIQIFASLLQRKLSPPVLQRRARTLSPSYL